MTDPNHFDPEDLAQHLDNLLSGDLESLPTDDPLLDLAQDLMNEPPAMPSVDALKRMQEGMLKANAQLHPMVNPTPMTTGLTVGQLMIVGTLTIVALIGVVMGTVWVFNTLLDEENVMTAIPIPTITLEVTHSATLDSVIQDIPTDTLTLTSSPTLTLTSTLTNTPTSSATMTQTATMTATLTATLTPTPSPTDTDEPVSNNDDAGTSDTVVQTPPVIAPTSPPPVDLGGDNDNNGNNGNGNDNNGNNNPGDFGCEHRGNYCNSQGTPGGSSPGNSGGNGNGNNGNSGGNGNGGGNNGNGRGNGG